VYEIMDAPRSLETPRDHTVSLVNLDRMELGASLREVLFGLGAVPGDLIVMANMKTSEWDDRLSSV
jgi:hypothetical protein